MPKILVIRFGAMGDVLHAAGSVQQVKRLHPESTIHWLTDPMYADLISAFQEVSQVWTWRKPDGWFALVRLARLLRAQRFEAVINWHPSVKTALLGILLYPSPCFTYHKQKHRKTGLLLREMPRLHAVQDFYRPLQRWLQRAYPGDEAPLPSPHQLACRLSAECFPLPASILEDEASYHVAIIPGVGHKRGNRAIPLPEVIRVIREVGQSAPNATLHLIGGVDDHVVAAAILKALDDETTILERIRNQTGRLSLQETASLLSRCQWVLGGDTGPTHLAAALGCRVISVFGPTDPRRSGPLSAMNDPTRIQWLTPPDTLACAPCEKPHCPLTGLDHLACLQQSSLLSQSWIAGVE